MIHGRSFVFGIQLVSRTECGNAYQTPMAVPHSHNENTLQKLHRIAQSQAAAIRPGLH